MHATRKSDNRFGYPVSYAVMVVCLALAGRAIAAEAGFLRAESLASTGQSGMAAPSYDAITIAKPLRDTTVFDRDGNVEVRIFLTPSANLRAGDRVIVWLDGQRIERDAAGAFTLHAVPQGRHQMKAGIIDRHGHAAVLSDVVEFDVSRNFSDRRR